MRWLFLFVLSLNLAYFAWESSRTSSADNTKVVALKNVEPIVLLSEARARQAIKQQAPLSTTVAVVEKDSLTPVSSDSDAEDGDVAKNKLSADQTQTSQVAVTDESLTQKAMPSETAPPEVAVPEAEEPLIEVVASSEMTSSAERCYTLGPFRDLNKLSGLTRDIKSYVVSADFRGKEEKEQALYWVYIQPEKTQKKAIETGRRLKAKKIKDFYVIREGEKINGLSLGRFRNKAGAYGLAKKVKKLGFNVMVEPIFKSYTVYWLDYQLLEAKNIPEATFEKHIKAGDKDKVNRLVRECAG